jgi:hypothetical protein
MPTLALGGSGMTSWFVDVYGTQRKCVYPIGRDPLLRRWQAGERETHPNWTDPLFWADVAAQQAVLNATAARATVKRHAERSAMA